jgi:hypothetical protein
MVDLSRLRGIALGLLIVSFCLACVEVTLAATRSWWPAFMRRDVGVLPDEGYDLAGGQLSAILREGLSPEKPIGIILGSSSQDSGIDTALLESLVEPPIRWRRLTVFGATVCELEPILNQVVEDRVKPAVLIIALNLRMLARNPALRNENYDKRIDVSLGRFFHDLQALRVKAAHVDLEGLLSNGFNDCFPDRTRIYCRLADPTAKLRMATLSWLGQSAQNMFPPNAHHDEDTNRHVWAPQMTAQEREKNVERSRRGGTFNSELYSTRGEASRSLVNMIRLSRSAGTEVVVLVMPESSIFRSNMPATALETLTDLLAESFGNEAPQVLMLHDAVHDDLLHDNYHLNRGGRLVLTRKLAEELNKRAVRVPEPGNRDARRHGFQGQRRKSIYGDQWQNPGGDRLSVLVSRNSSKNMEPPP